MSTRTAVAAVAVVLGASGCSVISGSDEAAVPPPPEVVEMPNPIPAYPDDGLHRFIVTPVSSMGDEGAMGDLLGGTGDESRSLWSVHPDRIDEVGPGTVLVFENGRPGYYDNTGTFVPVDGPTPDAEPEPMMAAPSGPWDHPALNALDAETSVRTIEAIGDGTYAVVATDAEVVTSAPDLVVGDDVPLAMADDPYFEYQWALENHGENLRRVTNRIEFVADADVDGTEAATMATGEGVVVAVVDTGVNFDHPDLLGRSWVNPGDDCDNGIDDDENGYVDDCRGWDFEDNDNQPFSSNHHPHGTHVAGIIAANAGNGVGVAGVAPGVQIMDLSVSSRGSIRTSAVARAIRYAVDNGADVVNLSLGSAPGTDPRAVAPMIEAVHYAEENGVLLVISAGNAGVDLDSAAVYPASVDAANVLTVGASMPDDTRASFSNHGTAVDLFAPGVLILSTMSNRSYAFMSGTSQAAPLVAGAAALVLEQKPSAADTELIEHLVSTGDVVPAYAGYTPSSARLNAGRAVGADLSGGEGETEEDPIAELVSITGLASATTDAVEATIQINTPEELAETDLSWEASLVAIQDDGIYAIVEHGATVAGAEVVTDDRGALTLGTDPTMVAELATTLPAGDYGLLVEAVSTSRPDVRLGDAYVAAFTVTDAGGGTTDPADPGQTTDPTDGADPGQGTTPTTAPSGGSGGTTPTTASGSTGATPSPGGSGGTTATTRSSGGSGGTTATTQPSSSGGGSPATTATTRSSGGSGGTTATTRSSGGSGGTTATTQRSSSGGGSPATTATTRSSGGSGGTTATTRSSGGSTGATNPPSGGGSTPSNPTTTAPEIPSGPIGDANGEWALSDVSPRSGSVTGDTYVSVTGSFPATAHVWFGDQPGTTYAQTDTWIVVRTPAADQVGVVDVTVRTNSDGVVLTAEDGFAYLAVDDDRNGSGTDPGEGTDPGTGEGTDPGTGDGDGPTEGSDPGDEGGDDPADGDDPTDGEDGSEDGEDGDGEDGDGEPDNSSPQERPVTGADVVTGAGGLQLRRLDGLDALVGLAPCTNDPCEVHRVAGA